MGKEKKLKNRLRRLVLDARQGVTSDNHMNLVNYIQEFNSILNEYNKIGLYKDISRFVYDSGHDQAYMGGLSHSGMAKIQQIITVSQNILDENVGEIRKSTKIKIWSILGVLFSGLILFLFNYFYTLGIKHTEKKYDEEKIKLYEQNEELKKKLDSCTVDYKNLKDVKTDR